jgi:Dehydratase family
MRTIAARRYAEGDVIVIRYEGPRGGPGMREMLGVTALIYGQGMSEKVALVTDGRFSGATRGMCIAMPNPRRRLAVRGRSLPTVTPFESMPMRGRSTGWCRPKRPPPALPPGGGRCGPGSRACCRNTPPRSGPLIAAQ